jgi:four helix bundle protein
MVGASERGMQPARHYRELVVWQLADNIRRLIYPLTRRAAFHADRRLREQTDDAIESVCRNIAEGFAGTHKQFRSYLLIARNSLNELRDCLHSAVIKGYVVSDDLSPIWPLTRRLFPAMSSLIQYLDTTDDTGEPLSGSMSEKRLNRP